MLTEFLKSPKSLQEKKNIIQYRLRKITYILKSKYKPSKKRIKDISVKRRPFLNNVLIENAQKNENLIIHEADSLCNNSYNSISGRKLEIKDFNWNKDYIFGFTWEKKHYSDYILKNEFEETDVKHVWESSRFYHLVILGQAYILTNDDKYIVKIKNEIETWSNQNPINNSVNWTVSMEVAIRCINLIQTLNLISNTNLMTEHFNNKVNTLIFNHGIYIYNNLEKGLNTNNHYLSNLVGLIWIGVYLKDSSNKKVSKISNKWIDFSLKQLVYELNYQVYDDGLCYEDSLPYHSLNTEMILLTAVILDEAGMDFPVSIKKKLVNMLDSLYRLLTNFDVPVFGDLDNGKLIICDVRELKNRINIKYLYDIAKDYKYYDYTTTILYSPEEFSDSGFYRLFNNKFDLIIRCGKIGVNGIGGHAHNDQLSFVMATKKQSFIIDSGTGYYSGDYDLRKELRSTDSHNTLSIKNYEQNDISKELFRMTPQTNSQVITSKKNLFQGQHFGYYEDLGVIHNRSIELKNKMLIIKDNINKIIDEKMSIQYILDTDVIIVHNDNNKILLKKNNVYIEIMVDGGIFKIENHKISKSYSETCLTKKIRVKIFEKEVSTFIKVIDS